MNELRRRRRELMAEQTIILPAEYQQVLCVGKNDNKPKQCMVDTGYAAKNNSVLELDSRTTYNVNSSVLFGSAGNSSGQRGMILFIDGFRCVYGWNSAPAEFGKRVKRKLWYDRPTKTAYLSANPTTGEPYELTYLNDNGSIVDVTANETIYLLGRHQNGGASGVSPGAMIYGFRAWEGETLVRDFVPCVRKLDNKAGFYDLCGSTSAGTGTPFYTVISGQNPLVWEV